MVGFESHHEIVEYFWFKKVIKKKRESKSNLVMITKKSSALVRIEIQCDMLTYMDNIQRRRRRRKWIKQICDICHHFSNNIVRIYF